MGTCGAHLACVHKIGPKNRGINVPRLFPPATAVLRVRRLHRPGKTITHAFSSVFYLDLFGEELLQIHPEVSTSFGSELLHVPHAAMCKYMAALMQAGPVAESLIKERCSTLARERDVKYVLLVKNPMELVLPLKRRRHTLPLALGSVLQSRCAETLQLTQVEWFPRNETCHDDWCNLPDAHDPVSQFLTGGKPGALDTTPSSELVLFYSALQNSTRMSCKKRSSLPPDSIPIVTKSSITVPVDTDKFLGTKYHHEYGCLSEAYSSNWRYFSTTNYDFSTKKAIRTGMGPFLMPSTTKE